MIDIEISSEQDVLKILKVHDEYFQLSKTKNIDFRLRQLKKLKTSIIENEKIILEALYKDLGKPEFEAYGSEIGCVLDSIRYVMKNLKSWAKVKKVRTPIHQFGGKSYIYSEPYGTVLIIGPFNYPFSLLIEPLIGAMAAGNCVVLKPSESTPNVTKVIKKIICGNFHEEYIRVVEGEKEVTSVLVHAPFDYIFFTGSVRVGKIIVEAASKNLVPVTLELGGKSPCIVDKSAKLDVIAKRIVWGKFYNTGQTCIAPDYLVVHKEIKDSLIKEIISVIKEFYGEESFNSPDYGRIINENHMDRLIHMIEKDKDKIIYGGHYRKRDLFIAPTVIDGVNWEDTVMKDEIFGPILPIMEYEDLNSLIKMINNKPKPLALYLFTEDKGVEEEILNRTSSGGACINDTLSHYITPYLPFGGVGNSGIGSYHGKKSFDTFSHKRSVMKKTTRFNIKLLYPPYKDRIKILRKILK